MHEGQIAHSVLRTILEVAFKNKAEKVLSAKLEVGDICLVNTDQLLHFIKIEAHDTIARDMEFSVVERKTKIRCKACSYTGGIDYKEPDPGWHYKIPIFSCPRCHSNNTEILEGREMKIVSIDVWP
jgi:hydrogenase nickel incorporation protein HypA/HybF